MFTPPGRQVGVTVPEGQRAPKTDKAPPNTVLHAVEAQMIAVQYVDDYGQLRTNMLVKVGGQLYMPPNGESWAGALRPCMDWMARGVEGKVVASGATAPKEDAVDVVGNSVADRIKEETNKILGER